jgi:hypothetical protein
MLSVIEVLSLLLLYGLLVLPYRPPGPYAFDFQASTEDVVLLGGIRAATLAVTYAWGSTRQHLRCVCVGRVSVSVSAIVGVFVCVCGGGEGGGAGEHTCVRIRMHGSWTCMKFYINIGLYRDHCMGC